MGWGRGGERAAQPADEKEADIPSRIRVNPAYQYSPATGILIMNRLGPGRAAMNMRAYTVCRAPASPSRRPGYADALRRNTSPLPPLPFSCVLARS